MYSLVCSSAMCSQRYCFDDLTALQISQMYCFFSLLSNIGQFSSSCRVQSFFVVKGLWHLKHQNLCTPFSVLPHLTLTSPCDVWNVDGCCGSWILCTICIWAAVSCGVDWKSRVVAWTTWGVGCGFAASSTSSVSSGFDHNCFLSAITSADAYIFF